MAMDAWSCFLIDFLGGNRNLHFNKFFITFMKKSIFETLHDRELHNSEVITSMMMVSLGIFEVNAPFFV